WCGRQGTKVIVKPVSDLKQADFSSGYAIPARIREQVVLRDRTCAFPHCTRPGRRGDPDHIVPFAQGGQTATANLAPLCRHHHRLKTQAGWTYFSSRLGEYHWLSPEGYEWSRDRDGTEMLSAVVPPLPGGSPLNV